MCFTGLDREPAAILCGTSGELGGEEHLDGQADDHDETNNRAKAPFVRAPGRLWHGCLRVHWSRFPGRGSYASGRPRAGEETEDIPAVPPEAADSEPVVSDPIVPEPLGYRIEDELAPLMQGWIGSGLAERLELGISAGGRSIVGVVFGGSGQTPLAERPTVLLVGALDGTSIAGAEAVLRVTDELLAAPERLPSDVAFLSIPWANPDGLARQLATSTGGGRNDLARDDDRDGTIDEDGPDDLDGDGVIVSLLIEDPEGPFARADDDRLLRAARPGDAPRFVLALEGKDDDGDGRFNEDGPGGIVPDLDFPVDWRGPWTGAPTGPWPLYSPAAKALAELVLERRVAVALLFQGSHGGLAAPGGILRDADGAGEASAPAVFAPDRVAYEIAARRFASATGRRSATLLPLAAARGEERPGAALDWLYLARGVVALEVSPWGPTVEESSRVRPQDARFSTELPLTDEVASTDDRQAPAHERAWANWVDNTRGGIGFLDWQPIDLGAGTSGLIGGWLPRTRMNPPDELLPQTARGLGDFVRGLASDLPQLEIELSEQERSGGEVCIVRARVRNRGALPTGVGSSDNGFGVSLFLDVPEGVEVLVGETEHALGHIAGGGASAEFAWVLLMPENAGVTLRAKGLSMAPVTREVRP